MVDDSQYNNQEEVKEDAAARRERRIDAQVWVVGVICETTYESKIYIVPNRNHITMQDLFERSCREGATIYHDGWAAYNHVDW